MHTMNQINSHSTVGESNSVRKGRRTQDIPQKHAIFTSHKFFPYTDSHYLIWQECQAKDEVPHLGASLSTSKVRPSKSKWMKPNG